MIVWQGFGFLALILPILGYVLTAKLVGSIEGTDYLASHSWPGALGTLIGAAIVWLLALVLDKPGKTLVDPATGQTVTLKKKHTLFWIPIKYVAIIMAGVALFILLVQHESTT